MRTLEERLGYTFRDRKRLEGALYHSSYANEHRSLGIHSNERLEFLGDAVLGLVTADYLFHRHLVQALLAHERRADAQPAL